MKLFLVWFSLLATINFTLAKDTLSVLFIGNSYTYYNNMPQLVRCISEDTETVLITRKSTKGGATLKEHWNQERNLKSREILEQQKFDYVVLQDQSLATINNQSDFHYYMGLFIDLIKSKGSKPILYTTWARLLNPLMQDQITLEYQKMATQHNIQNALVGEAFRESRSLRPADILFKEDGTHPSQIGSYIAACVFVKTITGNLPKTRKKYCTYRDKDNETLQLIKLNEITNQYCLDLVNNMFLEDPEK